MHLRIERKKDNKLAAFRQIFEMFVGHCNQNYNPETHLTVDEQRERCPFCVYMKSKSGRYDIKVWALVDVKSTYVKNL